MLQQYIFYNLVHCICPFHIIKCLGFHEKHNTILNYNEHDIQVDAIYLFFYIIITIS